MVRQFCNILLYTALSCVTLQELQKKAAYKAENCLFLQQLQDEAASEAESEVWGRFGSLLEVLGAFRESLGGPLGVFREPLGSSLDPLEHFLERLEDPRRPLGPSWEALGGVLGHSSKIL